MLTYFVIVSKENNYLYYDQPEQTFTFEIEEATIFGSKEIADKTNLFGFGIVRELTESEKLNLEL